MSNRMPWEKFWYRDFCDDLRRVSLAARGFWIFCLSEMWSNGGRAEITGSYTYFSRLFSCSETEVKSAVFELQEHKICDIAFSTREQKNDSYGNADYIEEITLRNRRLKREEKYRENARLRKQRWNEKQQRNALVTPIERKKEHQNDAQEEKKKEEKNKYIAEFFKLWDDKFQQKFSQKYVFAGAKETMLLKKLLQAFPSQELKQKMDIFFSCNDEFIKKSGYTIGVFFSQINKLSTLKKSRWS